ncbi:glycosyltransferase family 8 protein [Citrobacter werkmanii]|uniref:glycosyltransferase family 8 protein n=1 Tax=Citrobacter werkmanii TaxID=67827 RepID=UPI001D0ADDB1|nr:glycosyltransferase [Citrobacter werkmanii]UBX44914.1 glycosyltransferase family 8 protein [Citrobacter werkmanii]
MDVLAQYIKKEYSFTNNSLLQDQGSYFNIAYGTDANYQMGAAISIASILEHNKERQRTYCFHVFTNLISEEYARRLKSISEQFDASIHVYTVDERILDKLPVSAIWPLSIYYRLLAFDYLSQSINSLLYLDSDVICKNELTELEELYLGDNFAAVIPDIESTQKKNQQRLNINFNGKYFNSGVIYANLRQWKEKNVSDQVFSLIKNEGDRLKYPDQDALNIIFRERLIYLNRIYNAIYPLKSEFEYKDKDNYKKYISAETVLIHYTGVTKPWHEWGGYEASSYFRTIYDLTPWRNDRYLKAKTKPEYKEAYKHYIYQRRYIKALYLLFLYQKVKVFN